MMVLHELTSRFELIRLNVSMLLLEDVQLPEFKGSMWHGWFGQMLKAHDGRAYHICFGEFDQRQPKPYMVCPVGDNKLKWRKGELIQVEISLFGRACELANTVVEAIKASVSNNSIGIGICKAPYQVVSISSVTPKGFRAGVHTTSLCDWYAVPTSLSVIEQELALQFVTPVRVKFHGQLVRSDVPEMSFWLNHIIRRLVLLSRYWVLDNDCLMDAIYQEAQSLMPSYLSETNSFVVWEDWLRYSKTHKDFLPFGGLSGQISFFGEIQNLIPYFQIGEQLHLGGKTTFGLGRFQVIY